MTSPKQAASGYLNRPLRTEAAATAARHMTSLRAMLEHQRTTLAVYENANGQNYRDLADALRDDIAALRWALLQLDPQVEGPAQCLGDIMRAGE